MVKKEMIAMLLAGGQGQQAGRIDRESGKTSSSIWRQISNH